MSLEYGADLVMRVMQVGKILNFGIRRQAISQRYRAQSSFVECAAY